MKYSLPDLPYAYDALEPHIDARTMEIHHSKHHQAYVDNLNAALEKHPQMAEKPLEELLRSLDGIPEDIRTAVRNNGGGHFNHSLFWTVMAPASKASASAKAIVDKAEGKPEGDLAKAIDESFGNFERFKGEFSAAAKTRFGSGWAWLALSEVEGLVITSTPNQDSPVMEGKTAILGLDVWEHAYYLKYQNKRPDYIEAWWSVVNWGEVAKRYKESA